MRRQRVQAWARLWGLASIKMLDWICHVKLEFRGLEHVPTGAALVAAKHQSFFETFALLIVLKDLSFVFKRELTRIPLFGWYLWGVRQISIDRGKGGSALTQLIKGARKIFAENRQLVIFPEGTRRPVGAPPHYKSGVALIAANTETACVPVALNSGLFWPRRQFLRRPGTLVIEFLPAIAPGLDRRVFMSVLETRIETATERLVAEALAKNPELASALPDAKLASA
jgi:1-acyl-sn-glycerol-3-phosphate acyltransferase